LAGKIGAIISATTIASATAQATLRPVSAAKKAGQNAESSQ